jgi:hypothetical protein
VTPSSKATLVWRLDGLKPNIYQVTIQSVVARRGDKQRLMQQQQNATSGRVHIQYGAPPPLKTGFPMGDTFDKGNGTLLLLTLPPE